MLCAQIPVGFLLAVRSTSICVVLKPQIKKIIKKVFEVSKSKGIMQIIYLIWLKLGIGRD